MTTGLADANNWSVRFGVWHTYYFVKILIGGARVIF